MKSTGINNLLSDIAFGIIFAAVHMAWLSATFWIALQVEWRWGSPDGNTNDGLLGFAAFVAVGVCLSPVVISVWVSSYTND